MVKTDERCWQESCPYSKASDGRTESCCYAKEQPAPQPVSAHNGVTAVCGCRRYHQKMKLNKSTALILFLHGLISILFILGIAGGEMRAGTTHRNLLEVLPYLGNLTLAQLGGALIIPVSITGFLVLQVCFLKNRLPHSILGATMLLLLSLAAAFLNSNSTQGPFSFLPDGFRTTYRLLTGNLSEKAWSADTWVLQASMMWWFLLWTGLIVARNSKWMITKPSMLSSRSRASA